MKRTVPCLVLFSLTLSFCGCSEHKLETGYVYTPLGSNSDKRRGYYADPFSPEARAAQAEDRTPGIDLPRPVPGK